MLTDHIESSLRSLAVPLCDVFPDPANLRLHPERNLTAIVNSLRAFGQQRPILCDAKGRIIAGNGTYAAAKQLGWESIAVTKTALDGAQAAAYAIADNRTAILADWDDEALRTTLDALAADVPLDVMGWTAEEFAADFVVPSFAPVGEDEQGRLDEKASTTCPKCGHVWTP